MSHDSIDKEILAAHWISGELITNGKDFYFIVRKLNKPNNISILFNARDVITQTFFSGLICDSVVYLIINVFQIKNNLTAYSIIKMEHFYKSIVDDYIVKKESNIGYVDY